LEFRTVALFMGTGKGGYSGLTSAEFERRAWKNYGRMARALLNAGFPPDTWMRMEKFRTGTIEAPISEAVEYKAKKDFSHRP